jgi:isoquinoline 1-oxidoreductase subunit beta
MGLSKQVGRREVLRWAASGGGLLLSAAWLPGGASALDNTASDSGVSGSPPSGASRANARLVTAWVLVARDGSITLIASQSEMGQGTTTTLAAALADELYLPWEQVRIEFAPFDPAYRDPVFHWMFTGNSQGITSFYDVMRQMGAAAREMLLAAAATRLDVDAGSLSMTAGRIHHHPSGHVLTFGQVADDAARLPVPAHPRPRPDPAFAGRAMPRWDIPLKVDGSAVFGIDVKVPGMLLAAVRCAPRFGARLVRFDAAAIRRKPGVIAVVEVPNGLAVVGRTYWQAHQALESAELAWSDEGSRLTASEGLPAVYRERLDSGPFHTYRNTGDAAKALESCRMRLDALYEIPFQAHATMEPMNCTARVARNRCDIWAPTQGVEMVQNVAMQVTGLPSDRITVHRTLIGGGFGRRLLADFVKQALIIAMSVKAPVKLVWSREEDMTHDAYRPAMLHRISGGVSDAGALLALAHRIVSPSFMLYVFPRAGFPQVKDWTQPVLPPAQYDPMAVEGVIDIPYQVPHQQVEQHRLELDVPLSVWRTTGHGANNFVLESFVDELAHAARVDPLQFRRAALGNDRRTLAVLDVLAAKADWSRPLPAGYGRGMALARAFGGLAACAAEVTVSGPEVRVRRVVMALDCGRTLDPGIATSNALGGIVWGLSGMKTAMTFEGGRAAYSNFDGFEPLHLWETPPCEAHFIDSGAPLGGTGELGPVPVQAAVGNAIFAASGRRLRALPLSASGLRLAAAREARGVRI